MRDNFFVKVLVMLFILFHLNTLKSICASDLISNEKTNEEFNNDDIEKILPLSREDSTFLHLNESTKDNYVYVDDFKVLKNISSNGNPYYIRSLLSIYLNKNRDRFGSAKIFYKQKAPGSKIQNLSVDSADVWGGMLAGINPKTELVDVNFDGYEDIHISFVENTTGRSHSNYFYLFNPATNLFVPDSALNIKFGEMHISINIYDKLISVGGRVGAGGFMGGDYKWDGNDYIYTTKYNIDNGFPQISIKKEMINGKWVITEIDTLD
jgi:hypothetical protein